MDEVEITEDSSTEFFNSYDSVMDITTSKLVIHNMTYAHVGEYGCSAEIYDSVSSSTLFEYSTSNVDIVIDGEKHGVE